MEVQYTVYIYIYTWNSGRAPSTYISSFVLWDELHFDSGFECIDQILGMEEDEEDTNPDSESSWNVEGMSKSQTAS